MIATLVFILIVVGLVAVGVHTYLQNQSGGTVLRPGPGAPIPEGPSETEPDLVEDLDISSRAKNVLLENNLKTVAEIRYLDGDLEEIDGIGESYANEIREAVFEE